MYRIIICTKGTPCYPFRHDGPYLRKRNVMLVLKWVGQMTKSTHRRLVLVRFLLVQERMSRQRS